MDRHSTSTFNVVVNVVEIVVRRAAVATAQNVAKLLAVA